MVENLPANVGDTGSSPGLGRSHMPLPSGQKGHAEKSVQSRNAGPAMEKWEPCSSINNLSSSYFSPTPFLTAANVHYKFSSP